MFFFLIKNIENIDKNNEVWASQQVVKKKASILQILMVELHGYFEEHYGSLGLNEWARPWYPYLPSPYWKITTLTIFTHSCKRDSVSISILKRKPCNYWKFQIAENYWHLTGWSENGVIVLRKTRFCNCLIPCSDRSKQEEEKVFSTVEGKKTTIHNQNESKPAQVLIFPIVS